MGYGAQAGQFHPNMRIQKEWTEKIIVADETKQIFQRIQGGQSPWTSGSVEQQGKVGPISGPARTPRTLFLDPGPT